MLIIYTILLIVMSVTLFSWLYDNSARKKERDESILKFREQVEKYSTLSDNDLTKMRKLYKRRFSEKSVYHYQGKYNSVWLSPGFQNRWFDHCIDNIRVESIFWPPKIYSEQESHIKVKGLIYKDALFATHINDIDLIHERLKSERLPKEWVMRPVDKVYLEAFLFLPLPISIFSLIMSTANFPLGLSITLIFLLIVVGLIAFAIIRMHRLMKIEGECKLPQRKEEFDSYKVIDSILVRDPQKKLSPGESYILHCSKTNGIALSTECVNYNEYINDDRLSLFGTPSFKCFWALLFLIFHAAFFYNVISSRSYDIYSGVTEFKQDINIEKGNLESIEYTSEGDYIHIRGALAMPFKFGFMLCMNDSRIKDDNNLLSVIGNVRDKSSGYLSKSDYIENLKSENIEQCQVKIKIKEPVKDNSLMSAKDISDWIISLPDSRIDHHVINTLIGYIYGIEFSKDYPLSGLIISNQNDHDGSTLITLDNTLSPVTDDKIKSVKYKLMIHGILTTIYLICFALFLLGIVRDKRMSLNQYNK